MTREIHIIVLAMIMCYNHAKPDWQLNMKVKYFYEKDFFSLSILFNSSQWLRFKDCLQDESSLDCSILLASPLGKRSIVRKIEMRVITSLRDSYLNHYHCKFDTSNLRTDKWYVLCRRQRRGSTESKPSFYIYNLTCILIFWEKTQTVIISNNNTFFDNKGTLPPACRKPMLNTVITITQQTSTELSTSPLKLSSLKVNTATFSEITMAKKSDSETEGSDKKVPIIVGVVVAVIVIVIVTGIVVYRRRRHTKQKHAKSKNNAFDNSKPDVESNAVSVKYLTTSIQSRLKIGKGDTEQKHDKRHEEESSHQKQDDTTIDYTNTQNLPVENNGFGDESQKISETNTENYVNHLVDNSNGIYNNSITNPKVVGSELVYSTVDRTPQKIGEIYGVDKLNLPLTLLGNTYSNCQKPPTAIKDQGHRNFIQGSSSSPNYELATNINHLTSHNIIVKPEELALKPLASEYSKLGDKNRNFKNPYNTHPDTDDSQTLTTTVPYKCPSGAVGAISNMSSENHLADISSCQNDYSIVENNRNSDTEMGLSEYELATE